jgi:rhodanese-related sulfurtransferase
MRKIIVLVTLALFAAVPFAFSKGVEIVDKDELKGMLDTSGVVVYDVRTGRDWSSSEFKIKGAVRLTGKDIAGAIETTPKDSTIVLYCA